MLYSRRAARPKFSNGQIARPKTQGVMDGSATIRFSGLGVAKTDRKAPEGLALQPVVEADVPDEVLMVQVCDGSREALATLFRRYARLVRTVSFRVLRDVSEAEDLVQDVFLLVHRDCKAFDRSKAPARFWILQIAYRRAISRRRYLTSRDFYTRVELDEAAHQLTDPQANTARMEEIIEGRLENRRI